MNRDHPQILVKKTVKKRNQWGFAIVDCWPLVK